MTSGVKQALPQFAMPKTGTDGKAMPGRKGGADFTEALGKLVGKTDGSRDAVATRRDSDLRAGWPRFANQFDNSGGQPASLDRPAVSPSHEMKGDATGDADAEKNDPATDILDPAQQAQLQGVDGREGGVDRQATPPVIPSDGDAFVPDETPSPTTAAALASANRTAATEKPASAGRAPAIAASASEGPKQGEDIGPGGPATTRDTSGSQPFVPMGRGQQAEPIRFEPVTRPTADGLQQSSDKDKTSPEAPFGKDAAPAPRITVISQQNIPAPAASTTVVLVETLASGDLLEPALTKFSSEAIRASASPTSAQSLKIQLHPAELGMVTATLRFAGEQLSIELKVENQEAYRRLSADSDVIVNSLRDLGYDIDRVSVVQPSAAAPGAKADASMSMVQSQGRSAEQFGQGASGENAGSGGRSPGEDRSARHGGQQGSALSQKESAGGVYI
ncbi:MAG: flagellar hook-length control protein FliK [Mesorhizobium sp.]|nr:flagellar hook-length control protein FliK [Mesorhizobium sp.]MBL8577522.1 flagellar hook-length control protein FliK [Mesorhizobium sp.]